jgi:hypothetical protein
MSDNVSSKVGRGGGARQRRFVDPIERVRTGYFAVLLVPVVQFPLGMGVNLFVTIPRDHPGSNPPEFFGGVAQSVAWALLHGSLLLVLHVALGLLLVIFSVNLLIQGFQARTRRLLLPAIFGALGTIVAGLNGGSFLNYHEDFSSMIMAAGFAIAVVSYLIGLYLAPRNPIASENP